MLGCTNTVVDGSLDPSVNIGVLGFCFTEQCDQCLCDEFTVFSVAVSKAVAQQDQIPTAEKLILCRWKVFCFKYLEEVGFDSIDLCLQCVLFV